MSLTIPTSVNENNIVLSGTLSISPILAGNVTVSLISSDPTSVTVPAAVTFTPGQGNIKFPITVIDDFRIEGPQSVTITAAVVGWAPASASITVNDGESTNLSLYGIYSVYEGSTSTGTVQLSGTLPNDLVVTLSSSVPTRMTVPPTVTIPAGFASVVFAVTALENTVREGRQDVVA